MIASGRGASRDAGGRSRLWKDMSLVRTIGRQRRGRTVVSRSIGKVHLNRNMRFKRRLIRYLGVCNT